MPDRSSSLTLRVRYGETDQMGVVYHANYLVWCEVGRTEHMRVLGASYADMERSGVKLAVAEANLRYHAPARYDDIVRVTTTLDSVGSRMVVFSYLVTNDATGERLVAATTSLVAIDDAGRVVRIPPAVRELLEKGVAPDA
jgi:acyl-CoA thioester hydrolase